MERSEDLNPHLPASGCCLQPGAGTLTVLRDCWKPDHTLARLVETGKRNNRLVGLRGDAGLICSCLPAFAALGHLGGSCQVIGGPLKLLPLLGPECTFVLPPSFPVTFVSAEPVPAWVAAVCVRLG